jgi:hypothetical protein
MNQMQMNRMTRRTRSSFLLVGGALVAIRRRSPITTKSLNQMQMNRMTMRSSRSSNVPTAESMAAIAPRAMLVHRERERERERRRMQQELRLSHQTEMVRVDTLIAPHAS